MSPPRRRLKIQEIGTLTPGIPRKGLFSGPERDQCVLKEQEVSRRDIGKKKKWNPYITDMI